MSHSPPRNYPITATSHVTHGVFSISDSFVRNSRLPSRDNRTEAQKRYLQKAIIINNEDTDNRHKRTFQEMDSEDTRPNPNGLTHLVSPEAIRTAQQEEEAMSRYPFSAYPSLLYMKHIHEQKSKALESNNDEDQEEEEDDDDYSSPNPSPCESESLSPLSSYSSGTTLSSSKSSRLIQMASLPGAEEANALASLDDIEETTKPTTTQPAGRLKRPPNAYLLFNRDMRRKLLEISPQMTVAEISKEIGERWKLLPPEQRQYYVQQAALIKENHLKNHPGFIYTRRSKAQLAEARRSRNNNNKKTTRQDNDDAVRSNNKKKPQGDNSTRDPRGRKKKRHQHPKAPKHPMSGFLFYLAEVRPIVAQQYPGSTVGPISKVIASQWRNMSDEERVPWLKKAEEDKARYAREMQQYNAQLKKKTPSSAHDEDTMDHQTVTAVAQMVNHGNSTLAETDAMYYPSSFVIPPYQETTVDRNHLLSSFATGFD